MLAVVGGIFSLCRRFLLCKGILSVIRGIVRPGICLIGNATGSRARCLRISGAFILLFELGQRKIENFIFLKGSFLAEAIRLLFFLF